MYGVIDFSLIDTMPGGQGAFAPPAGWQGDYRQFLRTRFDSRLRCASSTLLWSEGDSSSRSKANPSEFPLGRMQSKAKEFCPVGVVCKGK